MGISGLPEDANYRDDGCFYAPSCLACPFAVCAHDDPMFVHKRSERTVRYRQIFRLRKAGVPVKEIVRQLKVGQRTVWRATSMGGVMELPPYMENRKGPDPRKLKPHNFKLAQPPSIADPGYKIYLKKCPHCTGDVEFYAPALSAKCLQCSRRWGRSA